MPLKESFTPVTKPFRYIRLHSSGNVTITQFQIITDDAELTLYDHNLEKNSAKDWQIDLTKDEVVDKIVYNGVPSTGMTMTFYDSDGSKVGDVISFTDEEVQTFNLKTGNGLAADISRKPGYPTGPFDDFPKQNMSEEKCREQAKADPKYAAWGFRNELHTVPTARNTCFLYTKANMTPFTGNAADTVHSAGCINPGEKLEFGCRTSLATIVEGSSYKCTPDTVTAFRAMEGKLRHYPSTEVYNSWGAPTAISIDCIGLPRGVEMPLKTQEVFANNGSVSCARYCMGESGKSWNNELPYEWGGAKCAASLVPEGCDVNQPHCVCTPDPANKWYNANPNSLNLKLYDAFVATNNSQPKTYPPSAAFMYMGNNEYKYIPTAAIGNSWNANWGNYTHIDASSYQFTGILALKV